MGQCTEIAYLSFFAESKTGRCPQIWSEQENSVVPLPEKSNKFILRTVIEEQCGQTYPTDFLNSFIIFLNSNLVFSCPIEEILLGKSAQIPEFTFGKFRNCLLCLRLIKIAVFHNPLYPNINGKSLAFLKSE